MAFQDQRGPSQKVDVSSLNIMCASCGKQIMDLPFNPSIKEDGTYGKLFCFDCNRQRRRDRGPRPGGFGGGNQF